MAIMLKEKKAVTLGLIVVVGILIGSYVSALIGLIPGENVVKTFFTYPFINFGFGFPNAAMLDLSAIQFQLGLQVKFSLLSIVGIFVSLYFFRWYK
jgi:ABC-type nitrate/sulfonate/bicarbonate transport system permease component